MKANSYRRAPIGLGMIIMLGFHCAYADPGKSVQDEQVLRTEPGLQTLLERLYRSFSYGPGGEPDWNAIRSCFVDNAVFIPERNPDGTIEPRNVDDLLSRWRESVRKRTSAAPRYTEKIENIAVHRREGVAYLDVEFIAVEAGDPKPRKPGLDSMQWVMTPDGWRIAAFIVQSESKLPD